MAVIDVNNSKVIEFTDKLESLHRSAFPSAVRNTLNDAAFAMKRKEILKSAKSNFQRVKSPTFFRKFTQVNKASGFDLKSMSSVVGFTNSTDPKIRRVVKGMEKQEFGGVINDGSRYLRASRGGRVNGKVKQSNYFGNQKFLKGSSRSRGNRLVANAYASAATGRAFSLNTNKGSFIVRSKSLSSSRRNGKATFKLDFLMMSRDRTPSEIKGTRFMKEAAVVTSGKIDKFYANNAEFQIKKHLKV